MLGGNPLFAEGERHIKGAVRHNTEHGIHSAMREQLRGRGKVAGGVVHENIYAAVMLPRGGDHVLHLLGVAHVARNGEHFPALRRHHFGGGGFQNFFTSPTDSELGAEFEVAFSHGSAESRAAAGDENDFAFEEIFLEHAWLLSETGECCARTVKASREAFTVRAACYLLPALALATMSLISLTKRGPLYGIPSLIIHSGPSVFTSLPSRMALVPPA